ncbi:MAG: hypothetical protein I3I98_08075 [Mobilibacterium timonense]|uniref:alginate O-acetyltransferase AlgX-related protein n=1 Tax=Mobilibacterium timonense TaxID=1871012 RepID=UPI002354C813|nr:hypothetical protein [Mobilibacterium timonense]MBM6991330.1 hypothetical protein [Mobilibacterium timonense]
MKAQRFTAVFFILIISVLCLVSAPAARRVLTYSDTNFQGVLGDRGQGSRFDSALAKEFPGLAFWMGVYGGVNRTLGIRYIPDQEVGVTKLEDGQLSYGIDRLGDGRLDGYVANTVALKEKLEARGVPLIYVQVPFKTGMEGGLERGAADYSDSNCDRLISGLTAGGVEVLDLRREMDGRMSADEMFFRTDHHWRPEAALMAAGILGGRLHNDFGLCYDEAAFDPGTYDTETYRNYYLGALGKKTGATYAGTDDFTLLTPQNSPDFRVTWRRDGKTFSRRGKFGEALVDRSIISRGDLYHRVSYDAYMNGRGAIATVVNEDSGSRGSILLVGDSYSWCMVPFLAMNYGRVTAVDMRDFTDVSLWEYLEKNSFDCVVIAYNPASLEGRNFSFFSRK